MQIPIEELEAARLKTKRRIAAALVDGLSQSAASIEEIAARIDKKPDFIWEFLKSLIDGTENRLNGISDIATALDSELRFGLIQYVPGDGSPNEPSD